MNNLVTDGKILFSREESSAEETELFRYTHPITNDYTVHWKEKLGTGISGPVRPCVHKASKTRYALKCLPDIPKSHTEVNLHMKCSNHPNIVKVFDVYTNDVQFPGEEQAKSRVLMVLEFMEGGELFDRISKESGFTEKKAARFLKQIALAVHRCHHLNVAHRDLKPENLLLRDNSEEAEVKLTDFGFAKVDDGNLQTPHFTPYYVAPQVLEAQRHKAKQKKGIIQTNKPYTYDKSCDMWSVGVILYIMLCGYPPFYSETPSRTITNEMRRKIRSGHYQFPEEDWSFISEDAKDVVKRLLHVDPSCRMDINELLTHTWLNDAPDTVLHSPAVFIDKDGMEDVKLAHSQHLTEMRVPDTTVTLKPLTNTNNPIFRKRKLRQNSIEETKGSCEPLTKVKDNNVKVKPLRDIIAYCILPPKVDDHEKTLNNLVISAIQSVGLTDQFSKVLKQWQWDGAQFKTKVEKSKFAHELGQIVKDMTRLHSHV
ncbi:hypothetical protein FSP39_016289 [Pinctada imbricata]|uniref:non-specific serine/threonine protein kinase n=1 Tax=Pinctada imbricata TaxID=66713 RepID=A0AA88XWV0_PINIB|nr:hypothetical protein FSP39_016289 [Pinctada imbricata]